MSRQDSRKKEPVAGQYAGLASLEELLNMQTGYCRGFLRTLEEEKQALVDMDMPRLISITAKKEYQLKRLTHLDKMAREKVAEIGNTLGQEKIEKLSSLHALLGENDGTTLQLHIHTLAGLREEIRDRNIINRKFTIDTLSYIENGISLITGGIETDKHYHAGGVSRLSGGPALISREV
ncbi:MAG: flagellar protein FlgN [Thermodesulfobacteriota bacterium]|nr:flagellar protein FlgN [Thermodesulfobacteriota bacterium]